MVRKEDIDDANKEENKLKQRGMKMDGRSCTDIICCLVFVATLAALLGISGYSFSQGDPVNIMTPFDSDGNQCGMPNQDRSNGTLAQVLDNNRDFSEYKYKYFTGLLSAVSGQVTHIYDAVCVKECPMDLANAYSVRTDCQLNEEHTDECPVANYNTTQLMNYCLPEYDSAKGTITQIYEQMNDQVGLASYIVDIKESWQVLLIMGFGSFVITLLYIFLLRWITKPLLYTSLFLIFILGLLVGYFVWLKRDEYVGDEQANSRNFATGIAIAIWVLTAIYSFFVCCQWSNIALGASIMEAAGDFLSSNTRMGLMPIVTYLLCIPVAAWWAASAVYLYSIGTPVYEENSFIANIIWESQTNYMFWFFLFGFFWIVAFIIALEQFVTGAVTCMWYFSGDGSDAAQSRGEVSISLGIKWAFLYHLGSIAFGSFLIAVITMIKVVFEYFAQKYESIAGKENPIFKIAVCAIRGCIWCLDCCVKFINENAYIQIALHNSSFCKAAQESFYLMIRHAGRFSSAQIVGWIMTLLGKGTIVGGSVWLTIMLVDAQYPHIQQPIVPAVIVGIIAWVVSSLFLSIFDFASLAILHCFIMDEDFGGSSRTPDSLKSFLDLNDEYVAKQDKQVNPHGVSKEGVKAGEVE